MDVAKLQRLTIDQTLYRLVYNETQQKLLRQIVFTSPNVEFLRNVVELLEAL